MHLKEFQKFEESRINFLKKQFNLFTQYHNELPPFYQQVGDTLQKATDRINIDADIRVYAEENRTNFATPAEILYEAYAWENAHLAASHQSAQPTSLPTQPAHSDAGGASNKFDPSTKTYGLTPGEASLTRDEKVKKLHDQMADIRNHLRAEQHSKKGLEKLVRFYAADPAAQDKAKREVEDQNRKITFLKDARTKVQHTLSELGDNTVFDTAVDDMEDANDRDLGSVGSQGSAGVLSGVQPVLCRARGLYDYKATNDSELSFNGDDILTITEQDESGWWFAELNGNVGFIPRNYVTVL